MVAIEGEGQILILYSVTRPSTNLLAISSSHFAMVDRDQNSEGKIWGGHLPPSLEGEQIYSDLIQCH